MTRFGRGTQRAVGLGIAGLVLWGCVELAVAQVLTLNPSNLPGSKVQPTPTSGAIYFFCYDITTLALMDCGVLAELRPLDPTFGGHDGHNLANQDLGKLGDASGCCDKSVQGNTGGGIFPVKYVSPEASGQVQLVVTWTPPPTWLCADNVEGVLGSFRSPCTGIGHFDVGFPLQPLVPLDDPSYLVVRGDTNRHPDGTSATAKTIQRLKQIADAYSVLVTPFFSGARLSINDISLPKGGLFDWKTDWVVPHQTHRRGTEVDINQAPVDASGSFFPQVPCPDDLALQAAVDIVQVDLGASLPALTCETNGKPDPEGPQKHIRF